MAEYKQGEAAKFLIGPFLTTAGALATDLTIGTALPTMYKNGATGFATLAGMSGAAASHSNQKAYYIVNAASGDMDAVGPWKVQIANSSALPIVEEHMILSPSAYDMKYSTVTVEFTGLRVDLVDSPNATAITAIQATALGKMATLATALAALQTDTTSIKVSLASVLAETTSLIADSTVIKAGITALQADTTSIKATLAVIGGETTAIKVQTDKFASMISTDASDAYIFTTKALENAPTGGGVSTAELATQLGILRSTVLGKLTTVTTALTALQADTTSLKTDSTVIKAGVAALQADTTSIKTVLASVAAETTVIKADTTSIKTSLTNLAADTTSIKVSLASVLAETSAIKAETTVIKAGVSALQTDTTSIKVSLASVLSETTSLIADSTVIKAGVAALQADTTSLKADSTVIKAGVAALQADTTSLKADSTSIKASLTTISGETTAIKVVTDALGSAAAAKLALSAGTIVSGTVSHDNTVATTTVFYSDDITEATTDHYKGRLIMFTSGALTDQVTEITAYSLVSGEGKFTVVALTEAPADNVTFIIV